MGLLIGMLLMSYSCHDLAKAGEPEKNRILEGFSATPVAEERPRSQVLSLNRHVMEK